MSGVSLLKTEEKKEKSLSTDRKVHYKKWHVFTFLCGEHFHSALIRRATKNKLGFKTWQTLKYSFFSST